MKRDLRSRLLAKSVAVPTGCWLWTGGLTGGYGRIGVAGKFVLAHRVSYELFVGPVPDGLVIDHLCRVTSCINPAHLEPVTQRVNTLRGIGAGARNAQKTACNNGHAYTAESMTIRPDGARVCLICKREHMARKRQELAAQGLTSRGTIPRGSNQALASTPTLYYGTPRGVGSASNLSAARGSAAARSGAPSSPWAKDERTDTRVFNLLPREGSMSGAPSMASRRAAPARRPYTLGGAR